MTVKFASNEIIEETSSKGNQEKLPPMEVFVHWPKTPKGKAELEKELAIFHAEHARKMIQQLPCPVDQKLEILDAVVREAKRKDT